MHYGRANQKLLKEWHELYRQPRISGDDMNTLQVGRPIVSRYHRNRRFYRQGKGANHKIHDFPSSEMGIKLGGFMVQHAQAGHGRRRRSLWEEREWRERLLPNAGSDQIHIVHV